MPGRQLFSFLAASFQAKLVAALMGLVALILASAFLTLQWVTSTQVTAEVERASERARLAFTEWEELRVNELERLGRPFTGNVRSAVLLDEAVTRGADRELLAQDAAYELERAQIDTSLVTFTDPSGGPILSLMNGERSADDDPANVAALVRRLIDGGTEHFRGYRRFGDQLFLVQVDLVFLGPAPVGAVAFGSPVTDGDARSLGEVVGARVCLIVEGECVAGTPGQGPELMAAVLESSPDEEGRRVEADGDEWQILVNPLVEGQEDGGLRVTSVQLGPVIEPFRSIFRILAVAGLIALLVAVALSLRLSRGLTRPVRELVAAAHRVGKGDYDTTLEVTSRDEMGTLGTAFNEMTTGLRLKEKYRGVLDKVVSRDVADELLSGEIELGGETRVATVLFADLRGFTALTENMEPQEVIGLLNLCMEKLTEAVEDEGGVVDKYVGDELMAIFGAPVSRGDDAMRACRAAERMVRSVKVLSEARIGRGEAPLGVGIGIGTGPVVAGNMGTQRRLNYTVLGSTVNLTARLCSAARAHEILISRGTLDAVEGRITAETLPEMDLKGFSQAVEVFRMTGTTEGVGAGSGLGAAAGEP